MRKLAFLLLVLLFSCGSGRDRPVATPTYTLFMVEGRWVDDVFGDLSIQISAHDPIRGTLTIMTGSSMDLGLANLIGDQIEVVTTSTVFVFDIESLDRLEGIGRSFRRLY